MRFTAAFVAAVCAVESVVAVPTTRQVAKSDYKLKERLNVPRKWQRVGRPDTAKWIDLRIGLKPGNFEELERQLYEVSDPAHTRYGQHLSEDEVNSLMRPAQKTSSLVASWLKQHGIEERHCTYSAAGDWINVQLPLPEVEDLLDTEYSVFQHVDGSRLVRTPEWSLPGHLHEHIDTIQPTNAFIRATPKSSFVKPVHFTQRVQQLPQAAAAPDASVAAVCNASAVTPTCLRTLYGTINYKPQAAGKNKVALTDYLGESNRRSDIKIFLQDYRPDAVPEADKFQFVSINGGTTSQTLNATQLEDGTDLEGNLDAETIIGITYPTPLIAYSTGGSPPFIPEAGGSDDTNEPYLTWLSYVLAQPTDKLPQTISTSYGDDEQTVPESYAKAACAGFATLGARGISLLFASGDGGVGGPAEDCVSNDGKNTTKFLPSFPASCPYSTTVGATKNFNPEVAALDTFSDGSVFASGGGFSNYFPTPLYQAATVAKYVAGLKGEFKGLYNPRGRAYPDLSAQGQRYVTIWNGTVAILDGTSASTPATTSIISLVNDALIAKGRRPLGFLNPWLYSVGYKAFTDVTSGSAVGCGTDGFPATKGWDAVTGFGTPNFPAILKLLGL